MNIVQIIVLYNTKVVKEKADLYYFDNSTDQEVIKHNSEYSSVISMGGNKGLPKVYNIAISMFREQYDYLQILDDDSKLENEFMKKFKEIVKFQEEIKFYLPTIVTKDSDNVRYPVYKHDNIFIKIFNLFVKNKKNIKTINSGLIINLKSVQELFDENLFLYSVDYEYSRRVIENSSYKIMDLKLYQDFSQDDRNIDNLIRRYRLITADGKIYYSKFDYYVNYTLIYLNLCRIHKTFRFIPEIIKL